MIRRNLLFTTQNSSGAFRRFLSISLYVLCALCLSGLGVKSFFVSSPPAHAQDIDKPLQNIDEEVTAFSFAPDGRIVYGVRRNFKTKKYDLEHDDIWLMEPGGKKRRLLEGAKFTRGRGPWRSIHFEGPITRGDALLREIAIKRDAVYNAALKKRLNLPDEG